MEVAMSEDLKEKLGEEGIKFIKNNVDQLPSIKVGVSTFGSNIKVDFTTWAKARDLV